MKDSLNLVITDTIEKTATSSEINIWLWIAIVELIVILILLLKIFAKRPNTDISNLKNQTLSEDVDFGNVIASSFHANALYDKLKVKCHPDRFPTDKEKNQIALGIFQEISKNKANLKRLHELKIEAMEKLNINF